MNGTIVARDLGVRKGNLRILDHISFTIQKGQLTGLIGPSGSGKTTLMRTIVGMQIASGGELKILGEPAGHRNLRARIGYVTQAPAVYDDLTVQENLRYFAALMKVNKASIRRTIDQVELGPQAKQLVRTLSGGQMARVSLAVALLGQAEIFVLDEPTVGLDPVLRRDLWDLFTRLAREGRTLLVSSHVMDEAERCDNVLLLRAGQLLWSDTKAALLERTQTGSVEEAFLQLVDNREEAS